MKKSLSNVQVKDATKGQVTAVFATFDVIDHDGDVTLKGAFTDDQPVAISAWHHSSWQGALPVGKGIIRNVGNEAVFEGEFLMDTTHGRDTFATVKALSEAGVLEWSYSLHQVESERGTKNGKAVRILKKVGLVKEVSPLLMGAGIDTRTLEAKGLKQLDSEIYQQLRDAGRQRWGNDITYVYVEDFDQDEGFAIFSVTMDGEAERLLRVDFTRVNGSVELGADEADVQRTTNYAPKSGARFLEQVKSVVADVDKLVIRASEVVALRAEKGKSLSDASVALLKQLDDGLARLKALIDEPAANTLRDEIDREYLRFVALNQGVTNS